MSKQTINIGASPNDGTGTPLRTSFDYTNQNFTEIYTALGGGVALPGATTQVIFNDGGTNLAGDAGLVYNKTTDALTVAGLVTAGSATITGALTVDTTTLVVDATNNRVGIGTASPIAQFANTSTTDTITGNVADGLAWRSVSNDWAAAIISRPASGNAFALRAHTGGTTASDYPLWLSAGASSGNFVLTATGNGVVTFGDGAGNTRMTLNSTGLEVANGNVILGTSGKGIDFSATASGSGTMTSELLDDYEEGTWTPVATNLTVVGSVTYTAKYTKIGNVVYINIKVLASTSSSSVAGSTNFSGLPFAPAVTTAVTAVNANAVASLGDGIMDTDSRLYTPTWTSIANAVLSGFYYV